MLSPLPPEDAAALARQEKRAAKAHAARLHDCWLASPEIIAAVDAERGIRLTPAEVRAAVSARKPTLVVLDAGGVAGPSGRFGVAPPDLWDSPGGPRKERDAFGRGHAPLIGCDAGCDAAPAAGEGGAFPQRVPLLDRNPRGCAAILAGEGAAALYCGAPAAAGSAYCAECRPRLRVPVKPLVPAARALPAPDPLKSKAARFLALRKAGAL